MQIHISKNHEELSDFTAQYLVDFIKNKPNATLVLTSGDTPKLAYQKMAVLGKGLDFSQVTFIGLDEWIGIPPESEGSCRYIVEENLLKPLQIPSQNYTFFDGLSDNLANECTRIDQLIFEKGGLDLIIVGIGLNGHIGLNEPHSSFENYCHVSDLEEITISVGQKYFTQATPLTQGITVGLKHLLEAQTAILLASGSKKADIIQRTITEEISEVLPSTVFQKHHNALLFLDEEAAIYAK